MDKDIWEIFLLSIGVVVFFLILGVAFNVKEIYFGFTLGGVISIINFYMLSIDVPVLLKFGEKAKKKAVFQFLRRYAIIFLILTIAIKIFNFNNFFGLLLGVSLVQVVIFIRKVVFIKK